MNVYRVKIGAGPSTTYDTEIVEARNAVEACKLALKEAKWIGSGEIVSLELLSTSKVVRSKP